MLFGLRPGRKILNENKLNTLIPISTLKFLISRNVPVQCIGFNNGFNIKQLSKEELTVFTHDEVLTEQCIKDGRFIHFPPDDIQIQERFFECKTVVRPCHAASKIVELIVRQNNIACCIQNIIIRNPTITSLQDTSLQETPYIVMATYNTIGLTCMLITDIALLQMILESSKKGHGKRSTIVRTQINRWIEELNATGKITYKKEKNDTVKHQKVTLFPIDYVPGFKSCIEKQAVIDYTEIVYGNVCEKRTLCGYIKKREHQKEIEKLEKRIRILESESEVDRPSKRARIEEDLRPPTKEEVVENVSKDQVKKGVVTAMGYY